MILVHNPKTRLVSPQYHVVHDESFDTVQIDMTEAEASAQLDTMLDALSQTSQWQHCDDYTDRDSRFATHQYFDSSWDLAAERAQASSQREHEPRQPGTSRKRAHDSSSTSEISISEGAQRCTSSAAPRTRVLPLRRNGHSDSLAITPPAPDPEGAVLPESHSEDNNKKTDPLVHPMQLSDVPADLATQRPPYQEASPLIVPARIPIGDDVASPNVDDRVPLVSQFGHLHSPPAKQLCSVGEFSDRSSESFHATMLSHLNSLVSQLESVGNSVPFGNNPTAEINFAAMQTAIDKRNFTFDGVSIDGIFNSDNPLAFAAGTKNNPDILSQAQMLRASDQDKFVESQQPEIQGLCDADVFDFKDMSQLPPGARLLNAIWSYRRKRRPDGTSQTQESDLR